MFGMGFGTARRAGDRPAGLWPRSPARDDGESREGVAGVQEGPARTAGDREGTRERRPSLETQARSLTGTVSRGDAFTASRWDRHRWSRAHKVARSRPGG